MELKFFHVTAQKHLSSVAQHGLREGAYLSHADFPEVQDYYAETVSDEGDEPIVIEIDASGIDVTLLAPDMPGIEEPLSFTLGATDEDIHAQWEASGKTWEDSVNIIGTARYMAPILPQFLRVNGAVLGAEAADAAKPPRIRMRP